MISKKSVKEAWGRSSLLLRAFKLIWAGIGGWVVLWLVLLVIQGALPAGLVYLSKVLVDRLAERIGAGTAMSMIEPIMGPALLIGGIFVVQQGLQSVLKWVRTAQAEYIQDHIKSLIHKQASLVDLEFYETPDFYDEMERANSQAEKHSVSLLENLGGVIQSSVTLIAIAALVMSYSIWLPVILLVSALPALWVVVQHNIKHHAWWKVVTEQRRKALYYDWILTSRFPAPEVRVFKLSEHFSLLYRELRKSLRERRLSLLKQQHIAQLFAGMTALCMTGGVMVWMVLRALRGLATLGDIALLYQAFQQGQSLMRSLLAHVGQLYTNILFLEHLFNFLDFEPRLMESEEEVSFPEPPYGIEIKDVDFRYPGSEQLALKSFSISIPAGKTVAIVGPNGAGKSTLIKLLCRFYDPEQGDVLLNGVDLKDLSPAQLVENVTVLFQHWVNYAGSVADTIGLGELSKGMDSGLLMEASKAGGVHDFVERLPKGYDTLLDKRFKGGVDLSGGQWQRIALARAFYRQAPIVLLDEPTSYMDPWEENKWLDRFFELVSNRTAVIVTHRFTTARRADLIYVMEKGRVVQSGTHEELTEQKGLYASCWNEQQSAGSRGTVRHVSRYAPDREISGR